MAFEMVEAKLYYETHYALMWSMTGVMLAFFMAAPFGLVSAREYRKLGPRLSLE